MFGYRFLLLCFAMAVVLAAEADQQPAVNQQSDPLPPGAVARIGADRWMHSHVGFAAFLPDGKSVVTVNKDQDIRVWQFPSGKEIRRMKLPAPPPPDPVKKTVGVFYPRVALARDRGIIAINHSGSSVVHFFSIDDGQSLPSLKLDTDLLSMVLSPDGHHLAVTAKDGSARIWHWANAKEIHRFGQPVDNDLIRQLAYSPDGKVIATGHLEKGNKKVEERKSVIKLWDSATWAQICVIGPENVPGVFSNLTFTPDGKSLAFSSSNKLTVVDSQTGKPVASLITEDRKVDPNFKIQGIAFPNTVSIWEFVFSRDGAKLYTTLSTGEFAEWDIRTSKMLRKLYRIEAGSFIALSPDNQTLLLVDQWWGPQFFDLGSKEFTLRTGHGESVSWLQFLPDSKTLLSQAFSGGGSKSIVQKWDSQTGKNLGIFGVEMPPGRIAVSPTGKFLAAAQTTGLGKDKPFVIIVDAASGQELRKIALQEPPIAIELRFSPDGKTLAILQGKAPKIELYDVVTGNLLFTLPGVPHTTKGISLLPAMVFSADGKRLLWYDQHKSDKTVLFDTTTGKKISPLPIPPRPKNAVDWGRQSMAFSPDGRSLIVDLNDATAALIEVATGKVRRTFGQQELPVKPREDVKALVTNPCLAFSPDGRLLAQSDYDHVIHIWDISSGKELAAFKGHTLPVNAVVFSPDGKLVASASDDSTALIWDVSKFVDRSGLGGP